jgi:hypothetical protein
MWESGKLLDMSHIVSYNTDPSTRTATLNTSDKSLLSLSLQKFKLHLQLSTLQEESTEVAEDATLRNAAYSVVVFGKVLNNKPTQLCAAIANHCLVYYRASQIDGSRNTHTQNPSDSAGLQPSPIFLVI